MRQVAKTKVANLSFSWCNFYSKTLESQRQFHRNNIVTEIPDMRGCFHSLAMFIYEKHFLSNFCSRNYTMSWEFQSADAVRFTYSQ